MIPIRLASFASKDLEEIASYYAVSQPRFLKILDADLDRTLRLIQQNPELYAVLDGEVRRALLRRFPYGVFYLIRPDEVFVVGVLHHARSPEEWRKRR